MVKEYEHLIVEDHGQVVICVLTNPPTHTFTSKSLMEVHDFLDQMEKRKDLRVLAFTGEGEDVFIKHYEVGISEKEWDEGVNKAVDKYYGSKYDKTKTEDCHSFIANSIPNGAERVKKVVQTLY